MPGWSNIYLQLATETGPIIGEGLLAGYETSIELEKFSWTMARPPLTKQEGKDLDDMISKGIMSLADAKASLTKVGVLKMTKRFDISSSAIHGAIHRDTWIPWASITVLHIMQGDRWIHEPGFTLVATDGHFVKADLDMERGDKGVEVMEDLVFQFKSILITYSKRLGVDNIPTNPFVYTAPKESQASS